MIPKNLIRIRGGHSAGPTVPDAGGIKRQYIMHARCPWTRAIPRKPALSVDSLLGRIVISVIDFSFKTATTSPTMIGLAP